MANNQKSGTESLVQTFYQLIYDKFNILIKEYIEENPQCYMDEDNFLSYFNKYFKVFLENDYFVEKDGNDPYLEFHTGKEEDFVFINTNIKKVKYKFNKSPFKDEVKGQDKLLKLAEEMGYDYKTYASQNKNNKKRKKGFRIPYSDFERKIKICAFKQLNRRVINLKKREEDLKKENENLKEDINFKKNEITKKNGEILIYEKGINDLKGENKYFKDQNERLIEEVSNLKSSNLSYKIKIEESNKKLTQNNKSINTLAVRLKRKNYDFEKFKKNYGVVIYNIWRIGRTIEKDYNVNKHNFESIKYLIDLFGKNLENNDDCFEDKEVDLEFLENQKLLINESLKSLERIFKQYNRVLILLEKSGIKIEEYDDIKNEEKLNVTILDVIESSEAQEIIVETVKPSIYFAEKNKVKGEVTSVEKRIFEGEVILTKPKK